MNRLLITATAVALTACAPLPEDFEGDVVAFNGDLVEIQAYMTGVQIGPTQAMQAQADRLCAPKSARFVGQSLDPESMGTTATGPWGITYIDSGSPYPTETFRFACLNP